MRKHRSANGLVEFVLAFPLFFLFSLVVLDIANLTLQQFSLERLAERVVRAVALRALSSQEQVATLAMHFTQKYSGQPNIHVEVELVPTPLLPRSASWRAETHGKIVHLTLQKNVRLKFPLLRVLGQDFSFPLTARRAEWQLRRDSESSLL